MFASIVVKGREKIVSFSTFTSDPCHKSDKETKFIDFSVFQQIFLPLELV